MAYIGNYAYACKVGSFSRKNIDSWLDAMEKGYVKVSPYPITDSIRISWRDCFEVLQQCIKELPADYQKLDMVFEYVLPNHQLGTQKALSDNGIRADVLLISRKTVMVFEFKRRSDVFIGHVRQAKKYRTRIQKYHEQSLGMNKKAILVLTNSKNRISEQYSKVSVRSHNLLADEIQALFEPNPLPHDDINKWLSSAFIVRQ